ncbi:MAG TPA: tripartite tricarboxylate transporter substrate binding protein [Burkholderiales bacterium]|nr:tripartite tricarboxylate transporter substrate binding protein [Burkholderiales bacterium]
MRIAHCLVVFMGGLHLLAAAAAHAQTVRPAGAYPTKPVRLIVSLVAGGPTDLLARLIAQPLSESLGQQVIVENRPGAGGNIGAEIAARSVPDGHTLLMGTSGPLAIHSSLYSKLPYDPIRDFAPVILVASAPFVVVAHPSVPARSIKELIALAKARPGQLNYGSVTGNASHLATELFKSTAGVDIVHIAYKGAAPATNDLLAGHIHLSFASTPGSMPQVKAGKLRALGVTSAQRLARISDVPTVAETLPGYEASVWYGVVAPSATPRDIVLRLNSDIAHILQQRTHRERLAANDFEPAGSTPEQFGAFIKSETAKWGKVVRASGARAD